MRWLDSITDWMDMNLSKLWEMAKDRYARHASVHGVTKLGTTERLSNSIAHWSYIIAAIDSFYPKTTLNTQESELLPWDDRSRVLIFWVGCFIFKQSCTFCFLLLILIKKQSFSWSCKCQISSPNFIWHNIVHSWVW